MTENDNDDENGNGNGGRKKRAILDDPDVVERTKASIEGDEEDDDE